MEVWRRFHVRGIYHTVDVQRATIPGGQISVFWSFGALSATPCVIQYHALVSCVVVSCQLVLDLPWSCQASVCERRAMSGGMMVQCLISHFSTRLDSSRLAQSRDGHDRRTTSELRCVGLFPLKPWNVWLWRSGSSARAQTQTPISSTY